MAAPDSYEAALWTRPTWMFTPLESVGRLRFGMSVDEAATALPEALELRRFQAEPHYPQIIGIELGLPTKEPAVYEYFDGAGRLFCIAVDAADGPQVTLNGTELTGGDPAELENWMDDQPKSTGGLRYGPRANPAISEGSGRPGEFHPWATRPPIDAAIAEGLVRLVLDLSALDFCDCSGLAALLRGRRLATERHGWVRLARVPPRLARIIRIAGLGGVFPCYPGVDDAFDDAQPLAPATGTGAGQQDSVVRGRAWTTRATMRDGGPARPLDSADSQVTGTGRSRRWSELAAATA